MNLLLASLLAGLSIAMLAWAFRDDLVERFERDVDWLRQTMWRFSPEPFNARPWITGLYAGWFALLPVFVLVFPVPLIGLVIWLLLLLVPRLVVDRKWAKHRKLIEAQLPDAVLKISSGVASGMTLAQAITHICENTEDPIRTEFNLMANQWKLGADLITTVEESKRRLQLENFNLFASALATNARMGGNVVDTLERLAHSLEAIAHMKHEVYAATAEGRANIKVLAIAPAIMLGLSCFIDIGAVGLLFTTPVGWVLLLLAGTLTATGTIWAMNIVNADV